MLLSQALLGKSFYIYYLQRKKYPTDENVFFFA